MKVTVDIPESLLEEAEKLAADEGVPLETVVERGLHRVIAEAKRNPPSRPQSVPFKVRRASFKGMGLAPDLQAASWDAVRDRAYEGRGS
jgi:hypothetical protein